MSGSQICCTVADSASDYPAQPLLRDAAHRGGAEKGSRKPLKRAFACCHSGLLASLDSKGLILHALEEPPLSTFVVFPFEGGKC